MSVRRGDDGITSTEGYLAVVNPLSPSSHLPSVMVHACLRTAHSGYRTPLDCRLDTLCGGRRICWIKIIDEDDGVLRCGTRHPGRPRRSPDRMWVRLDSGAAHPSFPSSSVPPLSPPLRPQAIQLATLAVSLSTSSSWERNFPYSLRWFEPIIGRSSAGAAPAFPLTRGGAKPFISPNC